MQIRPLFEHPLAVLGAETSGFCRVHEVDKSSDELLRRFDLREVPHTRNGHQSAPRNGFVRGIRMAHRDDVVPVTPDDQRRHRGSQVETIHRATVWPPGSITDLMVRANACRFSASASDA